MTPRRPRISRRRALALVGAGAGVTALVAPLRAANPFRQDQAPARRDFTITARNYSFTPARIEVGKDERVRVTVEGHDQVHSFAIDEFRIARRVQPGTSAVIEFRADRAGSFTYYCNIGADPGCKAMRGTLVVIGK
ncbi:MAG: cupredoxin domain-containing protein [Vicinamibacterales bacterium]